MRAKILQLISILLIISGFAWAEEEKQETITPPVGPYVKGGYNVYTTLEFIYWKAIQEGLNYADTGVAVVPGTSASSGKVHRPDFPWKPGFKVGIGYYLPHDGWDFYANYTWLHSSGTDRASSSIGNMVAIGLTFPGLSSQISQITSARSHWDLQFNSIDLELGRNFYLSRFLAVRPFGGLKFTWQDQEVSNRYRANQVTFGAVTQPGTARSKHHQDVWGVGIRLGGNGNWYFYRSWSIATKVAFSGVWLDYKNMRKDRFKQNGAPFRVINNIKKDTDAIKAVMELFLGLHGEWWFQNQRYHLALQGGFDEQLWINFGEFISFFTQGHGDFSMCGLTVKARFDF